MLVAMEKFFQIFPLEYQFFEKNLFEKILLKVKFATTFPQYVMEE